MVLANYVVLEAGIPKVLHFTEHYLGPRTFIDPQTGLEKTVNVLEFKVDREDGMAVNKVYSITSEKLARQLSPFLPDKAYLTKLITLKKSGTGFRTEYEITVAPAA